MKKIDLTPERIKRKFLDAYNGQPNFVTPESVEYGSGNGYVYEISTGSSCMLNGNRPVFGVTFLTVNSEKCYDMNKGTFKSYKDAKYCAEQVIGECHE
jgi:hypothetical protein